MIISPIKIEDPNELLEWKFSPPIMVDNEVEKLILRSIEKDLIKGEKIISWLFLGIKLPSGTERKSSWMSDFDWINRQFHTYAYIYIQIIYSLINFLLTSSKIRFLCWWIWRIFKKNIAYIILLLYRSIMFLSRMIRSYGNITITFLSVGTNITFLHRSIIITLLYGSRIIMLLHRRIMVTLLYRSMDSPAPHRQYRKLIHYNSMYFYL